MFTNPLVARRRWNRPIGLCLAGGIALAWLAGQIQSSSRPEPTAEALAQGREMFLHEWQPAQLGVASRDPLVAPEGDGLGPVFNANSCAACHFQAGVGGAGPGRRNVMAFDVVPTRTNPKFHAGVVHAAAVDEANLETPAEINRLFPVVQGERRKVGGCVVTIPDFNPVSFTSINTPALFGSGAIDRIPEGAIRARQRQRQRSIYPRELRGDFSATPAGRVRILADGRVGRFGWKAQFATLEEFVATACAVEIGLSNPRRRQDRPHQQGEDRDAPLDLTARQLAALTAYTAALPEPVRTLPTGESDRAEVDRGERLFATVGCADCHVPDLGNVTGIYSDLLLHKVEDDRDGGAYGRIDPDLPAPDGQALPSEWRTPPLWGVADSAPYFHDGASPTLEAAIVRHGVQARHVTERYRRLPPDEQQALVAFLRTLRAPPAEPAPQTEATRIAANSR